MEPYTKYVFVFLLGFVVTLVTTPAIMRLARLIGMVDTPDERRIHKGVIPRGGGLAVFAGFHIACASIYFLPWLPFDTTLDVEWWTRFLPSSVFLLWIGFIDDRWGLKPTTKLGCQVLAALAVYINGVHVGRLLYHPLPWPVDVSLTVFWCIGFVNAFNLIDGLDGLATGLGGIAATGLAGSLLLRHQPGDTLILVGFIGACLAFLRFNFSPARVFLGDSGSMFIGLTLAAVSLSTGSKGAFLASVAVPVLAAGIPILDTALAVWRRSARHLQQSGNGRAEAEGHVFCADRNHLHHRLLDRGVSQKKVATWLYLLNGAMIAVGLLSLLFHSWALTIYLLAFVAACYVVVRHLAHVELWASGMAIAQGLRRPPKKALGVIAYPVVDAGIMALALLVAIHLFHPERPLKEMWFDESILSVAVPFLFLAGGGVYSRVWSRARSTDFLSFLFMLAAGSAVARALSALFLRSPALGSFVEVHLFWSLSAIGMMGVRALPRVLQDYMPLILRQNRVDGVQSISTIVYGAGYSCTLFLRAKTYDTDRVARQRVIVGLFDDDPNLHGRYVHGYRVLGGVDKVEKLIIAHGVKEAVFTTHLAEGVLRDLTAIMRKHHVALYRWRADMKAYRHASIHFSFDRVIADLSTRMLESDHERFEADLAYAARLAGGFADAAQCCIVLFPGAPAFAALGCRWTQVDGSVCACVPSRCQASDFPWLVSELRTNGVVAVRDLAQLPESARAEQAQLVAPGVSSAIIVALGRLGAVHGFMAYYGVHTEALWEGEATQLLRTVAAVVSQTVLRLRGHPRRAASGTASPHDARHRPVDAPASDLS